MANVFQLMPNLDPEEMPFIQNILKEMDDAKAQQFALLYNSRRKDPQLILLTALLGFLGFAGVQRFIIGQIGMGILYFFTGGLCLIGTIIDLVNYKKLAFEYNYKVANEVLMLIKSYDK
jgi:TM2 domain-containing membrane protein YozV